MFDPGYLIFWPGAIAVAGFVALPVSMALQRWRRRLAARRNREWHCGQCNRELGPDDLEARVFIAHGVYVCATCAEVYRKRYRVAFVAVPALATIAGLSTVVGLALDPRPLSWYVGLPLGAIVLPSLGVGAAFWWRLRAAKRANTLARDVGLRVLPSPSRTDVTPAR